MKVSYIIIPLDGVRHIVRCINSMYRQTGKNFNVILAENSFGEFADEVNILLHKRSNIQKISDKAQTFDEKVMEAITLVPSDSDYVMFTDMSDVISPTTTQSLLKSSKSPLILPLAAEKRKDDYVVDRPDIVGLIKNLDNYPPRRFCFDKDIFLQIPRECFTNRYRFVMHMLSIIAEIDDISITDDICFYTDKPVQTGKDNYDLSDICSLGMPILEKLYKIKSSQIRIAVFDRLISDITSFVGEEYSKSRSEAFSVMQYACQLSRKDALLNKLFELKTGCNADFFLAMDHEEYFIYKNRIETVEKIQFGNGGTVTFEKTLKEIKAELENVKKELSEAKSGIITLEKNQFLAENAATQQAFFTDPALEVPNLYAQGKLGMRVILLSFKAWLKYKFTGNK